MRQAPLLIILFLSIFSINLTAYPWIYFTIYPNHSGIEHEATKDQIKVTFWHGTHELKTRTGVPKITEGEITYSYSNTQERGNYIFDNVTHVTVETTGTDGFFINHAKLVKETKKHWQKTPSKETLQSWAGKERMGYCLSLDTKDASGSWLGYAEGCHRGLRFNIDGGVVPLKGWSAAKKGISPATVWIKTKNESKAGTDSNIFLALHGSKGKAGATWLNRQKGGNIFEAGDIDEFEFNFMRDIGELKKVTFWSDGKHAASDWKIEYVKVKYKGKTITRTYNDWLVSKETATIDFGAQKHYNYIIIDNSHSKVKNEGTKNTITLKAYDKSKKQITVFSKVRNSIGNHIWTFELPGEMSYFTIETNGSDGFLIDQIRYYKDRSHSKIVQHWGRDEGKAWCLSTDKTDGSRSWKNVISNQKCYRRMKFRVSSASPVAY